MESCTGTFSGIKKEDNESDSDEETLHIDENPISPLKDVITDDPATVNSITLLQELDPSKVQATIIFDSDTDCEELPIKESTEENGGEFSSGDKSSTITDATPSRGNKKVELSDIDDVRRTNSSLLTALVTPIAQTDALPPVPNPQPQTSNTQNLSNIQQTGRDADRDLALAAAKLRNKPFKGRQKNLQQMAPKKKRFRKRRVQEVDEVANRLANDHDEWVRQKNLPNRFFQLPNFRPVPNKNGKDKAETSRTTHITKTKTEPKSNIKKRNKALKSTTPKIIKQEPVEKEYIDIEISGDIEYVDKRWKQEPSSDDEPQLVIDAGAKRPIVSWNVSNRGITVGTSGSDSS